MSYDRIYHEKLSAVLATPNKVLYGDTFVLEDPLDNIVHSSKACDYVYAKAFYEWIMSGSTDVSIMHKLSERAKKFDVNFKGRNTAYGPRILAQLPGCIKMLQKYPNTRRACIMILDHQDQEVAKELHKGATNCEYPCTMGMTFWIEDGKLNMHVTMRSNNYTSVVCLDVYNFTSLQDYIGEILGLPLGVYIHHTINAHILFKDLDRATGILNDYVNESGKSPHES